ncbi:Hypothetical predicted protein [Octopus vulgaris]|uniref:Uncharacterized protein n=1 Tax=Octopus vulgaris TaxID=6645 RepID=A0AA36BF33_OCTVU|nr:Hypothetical predicted protein [Octopus vulgaris]
MFSWTEISDREVFLNYKRGELMNLIIVLKQDFMPCYFLIANDHCTLKFDLVCEKKWLRSTLQSVYFVGYLFGSIVFGVISDRFILVSSDIGCSGKVGNLRSLWFDLSLISRNISDCCTSKRHRYSFSVFPHRRYSCTVHSSAFILCKMASSKYLRRPFGSSGIIAVVIARNKG